MHECRMSQKLSVSLVENCMKLSNVSSLPRLETAYQFCSHFAKGDNLNFLDRILLPSICSFSEREIMHKRKDLHPE